jgi:hypothetical protein
MTRGSARRWDTPRAIALAACVSFAAIVAAAATGCGGDPRATEIGDDTTAARSATGVHVPAPSDSFDVRGDWTIVGHKIPGVSAMSDAEANAYHGRVIHYGDDVAISGGDTLRAPEYATRVESAVSLFGGGYKTTLEQLGMSEYGRAFLHVTEVSSGGKDWIVPGGAFIWLAPDRGYTLWDGVMFEVRR